ncbi:hypothetical protein [Phenylobacterium sp.]|uniref:Cap15 family cyclic dinucleotide receptor domain-containing protein n=1 Tax=Phenylobacterium sp. TaxID=1871053 RepID=UPI00286E0A99|nr:hypothetical protein [Phenylobacterium sp.]
MNHEYSVLGGINRARIGQVIAIIAATVSSIVVALVLAAFDVARSLGLGEHVPPVLLPPIGAGVAFTLLYWLFDRYIWKLPWIASALGVPHLAGRWRCEGQTINPDKSKGYEWLAQITVVQSWDKIRVNLKTHQSASNSCTAALLRDDAEGFRLFYSYRNEPKADQPELQSHRGYAELVFQPDLKTAEGEYFNGLGRFTFGTMKLTKEA